jgi:uncharacterized protein YaaN involved in tellurite resistance
MEATINFPALTREDELKVAEFAKKIDLNNMQQVINYGVKSQNALSHFSEEILGHKSLRDLGAIGDSVSDLVLKLKDVTEPKRQKGLLSFFKKSRYVFEKKLLQTKGVDSLVGEIEGKLKDHMTSLGDNVKLLTKLEELNFDHHKELSMYIDAGKKALTEDRESTNATFFEKRLTDLQLSRTMSAQLAVQIRMIQANNVGLMDKVQSSLNVVIPMWKTQLLVNANLHASNQALLAQTAVTEMTNDMVVKNAAELNSTVVETAKQVERGIIDVDSLRKANESVINVFNEVRKITAENREVRSKVEGELLAIENTLRDAIDNAVHQKDEQRLVGTSTAGLTL